MALAFLNSEMLSFVDEQACRFFTFSLVLCIWMICLIKRFLVKISRDASFCDPRWNDWDTGALCPSTLASYV